jgi:hypothetical protein
MAERILGDLDQAAVYGVILYTEAHANIRKVLRDPDYWEAFDKASGPQWAVLAMRGRQGHVAFPPTSPGTFSYMVAVWQEPGANTHLLEVLELDSSSDWPVLLVFARDDTGALSKRKVKLDDSSLDAAYSSVKSSLTIVADALLSVDTERLLTPGAFHAVSHVLKGHADWQRVRGGLRLIERLRSFL